MTDRMVFDLVRSKSWNQLLITVTPEQVVDTMTFVGALKLAYQLLIPKTQEKERRKYGFAIVDLLFRIWETEMATSWKHYALLGHLYTVYPEYVDDHYLAYKRAMDLVDNPPPRLLIEMARCCQIPGYRRLPTIEAIEFAKQGIQDYSYVDGVKLLCEIYAERDEAQQLTYWRNVYNSIKDTNQESPPILPSYIFEEITEKDFYGTRASG